VEVCALASADSDSEIPAIPTPANAMIFRVVPSSIFGHMFASELQFCSNTPEAALKRTLAEKRTLCGQTRG